MHSWQHETQIYSTHQQLQCSHSVISFNPVSVLVTPLLVSAHCTKCTFLQGNEFAGFGFKQGVSSDQFKGLRKCKKKSKGEMFGQVSEDQYQPH